MNPKNADFYFNLGNTLKLAGRINQAKQAYAKAVYLNPDYSDKIDLN
jgi:tetratricopeptide (TPR) repeat protein